MWCRFLHQPTPQFSDNVQQFNPGTVPELASDPTGLRIQPTNGPHVNTNPNRCPGYRCSVWLGYKFRGSHDPLLRFNNLLERLTELRNILLTKSSVYYKKCNSGTASGEIHRTRCEEGQGPPSLLSEATILPASPRVHQPIHPQEGGRAQTLTL